MGTCFVRFVVIVQLLSVVLSVCEASVIEDYAFDSSDQAYKRYKLVKLVHMDMYTTYSFNITTLRWFDDNLSTRQVWWHDLHVNVPVFLSNKTKIAFLYIDGGHNNRTYIANSTFNDLNANLSVECNCITATLRQVPNQPIRFRNDPSGTERFEDSIISWTWKMFLENKTLENSTIKGVDQLPLQLAMTKAVVRAMDIIQLFASNIFTTIPDKFILGGISKRGLASWLTATIDKRVIGIAPIVFDLLNAQKNMQNQFRSLNGGYSFAFADYYNQNITRYLDTKEFEELSDIVDPYEYLDKLSGKKVLLIVTSNDEFMMQDNTRFFWDKLVNVTNKNCYLRRIANSGHFLENRTQILKSIFSSIKYFMLANLVPEKYKLPELTWSYDSTDEYTAIDITLKNSQCDEPTATVYLAKTEQTERRDFRASVLTPQGLVAQNITWEIIDTFNLTLQNGIHAGRFELERDVDQLEYWVGYFIEIGLKLNEDSCEDDTQEYFYLTTETNIAPEIYPIPKCVKDQCTGKLV